MISQTTSKEKDIERSIDRLKIVMQNHNAGPCIPAFHYTVSFHIFSPHYLTHMPRKKEDNLCLLISSKSFINSWRTSADTISHKLYRSINKRQKIIEQSLMIFSKQWTHNFLSIAFAQIFTKKMKSIYTRHYNKCLLMKNQCQDQRLVFH